MDKDTTTNHNTTEARMTTAQKTERRIYRLVDGFASQNEAVKAAAEAIGAVDMGSYYDVQIEKWSDGDALQDALDNYDARRQAGIDKFAAAQRARQGDPYAEFNPSDNDDGEPNH
jgi:hypothetical protein